MQGILIVDKPAGWTSFDVIAKLRGVLETRKLGHSGTLDPMATGVLPVFAGPSTKAADLQPDHTKAYRARVRLGIATDTGDITGEVTATGPVQVDGEAVRRVLASFAGDRMQLPPMYSAVKINGVPLYKAARAGKTVERKARPITIHSIELVGTGGENEYDIQVSCSKGTYIRVLAEEIGQALGCPATLAALRRTRAGVWDESCAHTLEEVLAAKEQGGLAAVQALLLDTETAFRPCLCWRWTRRPGSGWKTARRCLACPPRRGATGCAAKGSLSAWASWRTGCCGRKNYLWREGKSAWRFTGRWSRCSRRGAVPWRWAISMACTRVTGR